MRLRINNVLTEPTEESGGIIDRINDFADWFIGKETELFVKPAAGVAESVASQIFEWMREGAVALINVLNTFSPEIITLGVIVCAGGIMVAPLWNGGGTKWSGRLFVVLLGGVIWRMILQ